MNTTMRASQAQQFRRCSMKATPCEPRRPSVRAYAGGAKSRPARTRQCKIISIDSVNSDIWRLEEVADMIRDGAVGIIPTDTLPALVCDLENKDAIRLLYAAKEMNPKKPLSILVSSFKEINQYTSGFSVTSNEPGAPNWFNVVKRLLPGPYTFILPATKNLPAQVVDVLKGKSVQRKSVGVRMPDELICQTILKSVGRPLLCSSVHVSTKLSNVTEAPDTGTMLDMYAGSGIGFIVDVGPRIVTASTVVDMTGQDPEIIRAGAGDTSPFEME